MTEMRLLRLPIRASRDVFVARQRGREVAASVGMEQQDQVRVATALSEAGREVLARAGEAVVTFAYLSDQLPLLCLDVRAVAGTGEAAERRDSLAAAMAPVRRLVDDVRISESPEPLGVTLYRRLPATARPLSGEDLDQLRQNLLRSAPTSELEELAVQNRQLMTALEEVQRQRDELLRLNAELEETNRGVMALYGQLSQELEDTNRGVVALYAELDQRSAQLREASEAKSRFLANASHELRAPVASIVGLARLLADEGSHPLTTDQAEQVDLIGSSATDLLQMVNGLLDLAKAESGRLEPEWDRISLAEVFGQLRGTLRGLAVRPEVELIVEEPAGLPELVSDGVLLTQILRNLVSNALKFTPRGEVRLAARLLEDSDRIEIRVADTGVGIAPEQQRRVFEEFYQVPGVAPAIDGARGTGLGLPYARRLAMLLGGDLALRSQPGQGSTFLVDLPVRPSDEEDDGER
jgi:signal transduction histidine kinase